MRFNLFEKIWLFGYVPIALVLLIIGYYLATHEKLTSVHYGVLVISVVAINWLFFVIANVIKRRISK